MQINCDVNSSVWWMIISDLFEEISNEMRISHQCYKITTNEK